MISRLKAPVGVMQVDSCQLGAWARYQLTAVNVAQRCRAAFNAGEASL